MLDFLSEMVTFTLSSFNTNRSGGGRKSLIILGSPIGSSVYFIFVFIYLPSFPPIPCTIDANDITPVSEPDSHNTITDSSDAVVSVFFGTVSHVLYNNTLRFEKSLLCLDKRNLMFFLILSILFFIPLKSGFPHRHNIW
jgi:hypothetical protein